MKIWITTDNHHGHDKLIEYGRPADFTEKIFKNFKIIKPGDILINLGDFCIGKDQEWHETYFNFMPGVRHILIRGNHDSKSNTWYLTHGWDMVCEYFSLEMFGKKILFSHYPMAWDGYYDVNIHGHFHDTDHRWLEPQFMKIANGYQKLLALEKTDYKPVLLEHFINN